MKEALILFVRNPELGKVKTRISNVAGDAFALHVYKNLLAHTKTITLHLPVDKYVYYADEIQDEDLWNNDLYFKAKQEGLDLGTRMHHAFSSVFQKSYKKICVIGSDCLELTAQIIEDAFKKLDKTDVVIGPAADGGYYLLGMKNAIKDVFQGIDWSTNLVLSQTLKKLENRYSYELLPVLSDIDILEDLPKDWFLNTRK